MGWTSDDIDTARIVVKTVAEFVALRDAESGS